MRLAALVLACALAGGAQAQSPPPAERGDCFRVNGAYRFGIVDERHVRVRINARRQYLLTVTRDTDNLHWSNTPMRLNSRSTFLCVGDEENVQLVGGEPETIYIVTRIERLPPAEPVAETRE